MNDRWSYLRILLAPLLAGVAVGVLGALFLGALRLASSARVALIAAAEAHSIPGWLTGVLVGLVGAVAAAWLARRYATDAPQLSGSSDKETAESPTPNRSALAVNFAGTSLAQAAGLALGPERPAIQMGGAVGRITSRLFGLSRPESELLTAATGGAGVATMFNSPLGCAAYTVETVLRRVDYRISITALGVGAVAVAVTRAFIGRDVNFVVAQMPSIRFDHLILYLALGGVIAVFASLHVHVTVMVKKFFERVRLPAVARGCLIGGAIGWLAWFSPNWVGMGDSLTQGVLDGKLAFSGMALAFGVRLILGPLSLVAGTPGGYFTPVLLLGALLGGVYGILLRSGLPGADISPTPFALVGMAVALAATARAPFTGILLVMETTGAYRMALPMIIGVFGAVAVRRLMRTPSLGHGLESFFSALLRRRRHVEQSPE